MPFGKYAGKPLAKIPASYLLWLIDNATNLSPTLRRAIKKQLGIEAEPKSNAVVAVSRFADDWYRRLCKRFHPDKPGGSHQAMVAVNAGRELLLEMTRPAR